MVVQLRTEGAERLAVLSAQLKSSDKTLQRAMRSRLRGAVRPIVDEVKVKAAEHSKTIPRSVVAEFRYSEKSAGASVKAKRSRMPKGKEALPGLMDRGSKGSGGRFIRHPVFASKGTSRITGRNRYRNIGAGRRVAWVNQPTHPFLTKTVEGKTDYVRRELLKVLDDVERQLTQ